LTERAFHRADPRRAGMRLVASVAVGIVAYLVSPGGYVWLTRLLIAGVAGGATLLGLAMAIIFTADAEETKRRAAAEDPGRTIVWLIVLVVSALTLFTATFVLHEAKTFPRGERDLALFLTVAAGALSWSLTHAAFTLRYAHLYYRGTPEEEGGISFPHDEESDEKPDDLDFMYFAFTIGMCFQVSDAAITDRLIRRTALAHAMISFAYNTGIIALVLNVVMSQLS
jgi:uncharacterized membrane protein